MRVQVTLNGGMGCLGIEVRGQMTIDSSSSMETRVTCEVRTGFEHGPCSAINGVNLVVNQKRKDVIDLRNSRVTENCSAVEVFVEG